MRRGVSTKVGMRKDGRLLRKRCREADVGIDKVVWGTRERASGRGKELGKELEEMRRRDGGEVRKNKRGDERRRAKLEGPTSN